MNAIQAYQTFKSQEALSVYLEDWVLDIVCKDGSWNICFQEESGVVLGIWIYFKKQKLGMNYITMPAGIKYMGPIFAAHLKATEFQKVYDAMSMMLPPSSYFVQQFTPFSMELIQEKILNIDSAPRATFILDLEKNEGSLLENMDGNYRRSILKYQDEILCDFRQKATQKAMETFGQLLISSMGNLEDHQLSEKMLTELILESEKRNQGKLLLLSYQDAIIAGAFVLYDQETAYYLYAGNDKNYNKIYPGVQVAYKTIQFLKQMTSVQKLDFYGSSIETIAKVWIKLGAQKKEYPLVEENPSFLFGLLQNAKNKWMKK